MRQSPFNPLSGNPLTDRADAARSVRALFAALVPSFSASGARAAVDGSGAVFDQAAAELEGFARPLWGLAPLAAGGETVDFALFRRGLTHGADPAHPDYWGDVGDVDQRMVELAAIGFALALQPDALWAPLEEAARERLLTYLRAARAKSYSDNNWKFFRVMLDLGLQAVGAAPDDDLSARYLDEIEAFHVEGGWYRDGATRQMDWYVPFAFHFYGLIYAALGQGDDARRARFRQRGAALAQDLRHWFDDEGAALPFGRSLTYRFAAAGFWGALAFAGVEALPWGVMKGLYLRHLRWWARQPITRRDGVLSVGYAYPNGLMAENYNSPNSPYWAFKAFLPLALPDAHPFWAAQETVDTEAEAVRTLPAPGMVIMRQPGQVIALSAGQANPNIRFGAEKYAKFAYSTRYGFSIESERRFDKAVLDNMLGLSDDGDHFRVCEGDAKAMIAPGLIWRLWRPWPDVKIETWLAPCGPWRLGVHEIATERRLSTIEGGFCIPRADPPAEEVGASRACVAACGEFSGLRDLTGARRGRVQRCEPNTNLIHPRTLIPQLLGEVPVGRTVLVTAVLAGPAWDHALASWADRPPPPDLDVWRAIRDAEGRPVGALLT